MQIVYRLKEQPRGKHRKNHVWDWILVFGEAMAHQLHADEHRWGQEWRRRPRENQTHRIMSHILTYYGKFNQNGTPMPWIKVANLALIAWIRDTRPESEWTIDGETDMD